MMICFFVNGQKIFLENPDPETKLLDFLRGKLQLTGTKQGCNEGGCGCCTVMISKYYHSTDVNRAFAAGVNLSAQGFYHPPDDVWEDGVKVPYGYYCFGVGFSMVEIDTLTGNWQVMQTDIVMDVGDSLNPAIDIGQIEGAFVQGMGLFTMEECSYLADGSLYSDCPNPKAIFSSKAVGEPPLFLASSVFFAIRAAIKSAREERGFNGYFEFCSPATTERIRLACEDHFTELIK